MHSTRILPVILALGGFFFATAALPGAEAGIEFTGYAWDERGLTLALRNPATGNSRWVLIGQKFGDYTVAKLDEKTEILTVTKGGAEFRLPLVRAKVQHVNNEPAPEIKKKVLNNLRQLAAAADQYFLENGVAHATYDDLVGPEKYIKAINPADGEDYQSIPFDQGKPIQTTTSQGYVISYRP